MALKDFSANIFGQNIDGKLMENLKLGSQCFSETDWIVVFTFVWLRSSKYGFFRYFLYFSKKFDNAFASFLYWKLQVSKFSQFLRYIFLRIGKTIVEAQMF